MAGVIRYDVCRDHSLRENMNRNKDPDIEIPRCCKNIHTKDADTNYQGVHINTLQRRTRPIQGDRK